MVFLTNVINKENDIQYKQLEDHFKYAKYILKILLMFNESILTSDIFYLLCFILVFAVN